ncbi:MAG: crotonase/enoyl-CoA hydratase family protein [Myxococcales bacterium]|nr:crotonase/enoyl-CoA hydratase family protein [Myxococcales bacterium]MCB9629853.1 crotonase/enoyl-CoA hydratase family protein [Sandaracinaceae bacterium]
MSVHYEVDDLVARITLDRPEVRNAVDSATAAELHAAFLRFDADESAHVAVFTGSGGTFCAGADLKALASGDTRDLSPEARGPMGPTRMELDKPVIAAIEGHAVAGGLELALWCDLRVVAEDAILGVFCRRFGVPLIDLGTVRLPRLVGHGRAMDLILTGRPVDAEEALRIGLCERVAPRGQALHAATALARQIAAFPQRCMRGDRRAAIDQWSLDWDSAMRRELELGLATLASGETLAGASAFTRGQGRHGEFP